MALIKTSLPADLFTEELQPDRAADLTLSVPGQEPLKVCILADSEHSHRGAHRHRSTQSSAFQVPIGKERSTKRRRCTVWEWTGEGNDEGDLAAEYLSDFMGHKGAHVSSDSSSLFQLAGACS